MPVPAEASHSPVISWPPPLICPDGTMLEPFQNANGTFGYYQCPAMPDSTAASHASDTLSVALIIVGLLVVLLLAVLIYYVRKLTGRGSGQA